MKIINSAVQQTPNTDKTALTKTRQIFYFYFFFAVPKK